MACDQAQKKRGKSFEIDIALMALRLILLYFGKLEDMHREKNRLYVSIYIYFYPILSLFGCSMPHFMAKKCQANHSVTVSQALLSANAGLFISPGTARSEHPEPGRRNMVTVPAKRWLWVNTYS